jgi:hypothetical protein
MNFKLHIFYLGRKKKVFDYETALAEQKQAKVSIHDSNMTNGNDGIFLDFRALKPGFQISREL